MISFECPYDCGAHYFIPLAEGVQLPVIERHTCEVCKRVVWTRHSRADCWSMTDEAFKAANPELPEKIQ